MDGSSALDFAVALGEEFCEALSPTVPADLITPQDGYEVWRRAFGVPPTPDALAALSDAQLEQLRVACVTYFECPAVMPSHIRSAIARTRSRWPAG